MSNEDISQNPEKLRALALERGTRIERLEVALSHARHALILWTDDPHGDLRDSAIEFADKALADDDAGGGENDQPHHAKGEPFVRESVHGGFVWTYCDEHGPNVKVDEDGLCIGCGRDAVYFGKKHPDDAVGGGDEICSVCDGGPGNNGACLCGMKVYDAPPQHREALEALDVIVPELEFGRGTHVQWRDYLQQHPDGEKRNPECGDADFHAKMVEVYDKRLDAINKARRALTAPPTVPESIRRLPEKIERQARQHKLDAISADDRRDLMNARSHWCAAKTLRDTAADMRKALAQHSEPGRVPTESEVRSWSPEKRAAPAPDADERE